MGARQVERLEVGAVVGDLTHALIEIRPHSPSDSVVKLLAALRLTRATAALPTSGHLCKFR
eukprot:CAMPEP_0182598394 /NCGR_PEP_ID=MMETSP1324-20130603/88126_1 /TAXON_ID=236786 /ORGANISM="Florenciella sp., Strain RCC1587" /LENGTH=60 /DNA_ID=CAMNT_0024816223 /DNA_START=136 /DNA_END=316 /DNA_ORIENTATION=+